MTGSAGSLISVLRACLVDGYGAKPPAGWSYSVVHAASFQGLFTQGDKAGRVNKKLYLKDDASAIGNATAWMCSTCTADASPVLTEYFWTSNNTYIGIITKADQENGLVSEWMIVADARAVVLLTRRSNWGTKGWAFTFFGDLVSGHAVDKGCCAVVGWNNYSSTVPYGAFPRDFCNNSVAVFGQPNGLYTLPVYTLSQTLGISGQIGSTISPVWKGAGNIQLCNLMVGDAASFRGLIPFVWVPIAPPANFPWFAIEDSIYVDDVAGGRTLRHIQFDPTVGRRVFIEVAGFSS
jgi:hypothetical protein